MQFKNCQEIYIKMQGTKIIIHKINKIRYQKLKVTEYIIKYSHNDFSSYWRRNVCSIWILAPLRVDLSFVPQLAYITYYRDMYMYILCTCTCICTSYWKFRTDIPYIRTYLSFQPEDAYYKKVKTVFWIAWYQQLYVRAV